MNPLNQEIKKHLLHQGATIVGFADLSDLPVDVRDGYRYGISIAVALNPEKVIKIYPGPNIEYYNEYKSVNRLLDKIAESGADFLKLRALMHLLKQRASLSRNKAQNELNYLIKL